MSRRSVSPIGDTIATTRIRREKSAEYVAEKSRLAPYEAIARLVIGFRIKHQLTQEELADGVGTTGSAISRLESGQHAPHMDTLKRIAELAGERFVVGFVDDEAGTRELVAVGGNERAHS